jgi:hypothetical protein
MRGVESPHACAATARVLLPGTTDSPETICQQIAVGVDARLRQNLQVRTDPGGPGGLQTSITYTAQTSREAVGMVNGLAQSYANACLARWRAGVERSCAEAREAAHRAQQDLARAKTELREFSERQQREAQQLASNPAPRPAARAAPPPVDNPQWLELNRQLAQLQQQRAQLMQGRGARTIAHPDVQEVDFRIQDVTQQIANTDRWMPATESRPEAVAQSPALPPADDATAQELQRAVDQCQRNAAVAAGAEHQAQCACSQVPRVQVELAPLAAAPPPPNRLWLALAALMAGLTTATGIGMISTGAAMESPIASLAELRRTLPITIVGVLPEGDATCRPGRHSPRRLTRAVLLAAGAVLLVLCFATMLWAAGIHPSCFLPQVPN